MKCANCGTERPTGKFCPECGSQEIEKEKVETDIKCAKCGRIRKRGKFCPECGSAEIFTEPQVIVCTDCGAVRMSGKFCSECGSTNITMKTASAVGSVDTIKYNSQKKNNVASPATNRPEVKTPVIKAPIDKKPVDKAPINKTPIAASRVEESVKAVSIENDPGIELISVESSYNSRGAGNNISSRDNNAGKSTENNNADMGEEVTELLTEGDDDIIFPGAGKSVSKEYDHAKESGFVSTPLENKTKVNKADQYINTVQTKTNNHNSAQSRNNSPSAITNNKPSVHTSNNAGTNNNNNTGVNSYDVTGLNANNNINNNSGANNPYNTGQNNNYGANTYSNPVSDPANYNNMNAYGNPAANTFNNGNDMAGGMQYNSYNSGYAQQPYYTAQPRPKKVNPSLATPTGQMIKKCKIIIFVLAALEFFAMFLPATHYGSGRYSESLSLSDGNSFIIFLGLIIIAILCILAGFSQYFGAALGLLIQSLILSVASFFIVALVNEEGKIATKGIAYYIFLIVPIVIIIVSIVTLTYSIRLKNESKESR